MVKLAALAALFASAHADVKVPTKEIAPGVHMPILNIGTWIDGTTGKKEDGGEITATWLAQGGRGIDTALVYHDQASIAKAIAASGVKREDLFITSKFPACAAAQSGIDQDLQQLGTSYIDLMLIHSPFGSCPGTWKVLEDNVKNGKLKAIGISNFNKAQMQNIMKGATIPPAVNQIGYSVFSHNEDTIEFCHANNVTVEAYSPLGGGMGKHSVFKEPTVTSIAQKHNVSQAQVALKWIVQRGDTLAVLSGNGAHQANDADLWGFTLEDDDMEKLSGIAASTVVV